MVYLQNQDSKDYDEIVNGSIGYKIN